MKVLCLTKYPAKGPSSRYRVHQFLPYLADAGISVDIQALHDESYLDARFAGHRVSWAYLAGRLARRLLKLSAVKHYHAVFIQKEMFPYLPGHFESLLANMGVPIILDIDDAIHLYYERATGWKRRLLRAKIPRVMSRASLVLAGNTYLARYAAQYARQVVTFPTVVDTDRFSPGEPARRDVPVVGWMGTPQTVGYLDDIIPALKTTATTREFSMRVVGAEFSPVEGVAVSSHAWDETTEADELRAMDVGIMPLPDDTWSDGKCGLKLLQYMGAGVASIATPRGSVTDIVTDGENGFVATTSEEWAGKLAHVLDASEVRREVGARARASVLAHYSLASAGPRLAGYLRDVVEGREVADGRERNRVEDALGRAGK